MMPNADKLASIIAGYLNEHNETDNLGDGESLCLMGELPTINVVELAECILESFSDDRLGS